MNSFSSYRRDMLTLVITLIFCGKSSAFIVLPGTQAIAPNARVQTRLKMAPRFDPQTARWSPGSEEDGPSSGYGPIGTVLRSGPKSFLIRLSNADSYEQGVYKLMANENMGRMEAQANFDAYLDNPNDWAYQYFQEKKGGFKKDYVNDGMDPKGLALKGIWTGLLLGIASRGLFCYTNDIYFWEFLRPYFQK